MPRPRTRGFGSTAPTTTRARSEAEHRVDARRRPPVMRARLERDEELGAARARAGRAERLDLGVRPARRARESPRPTTRPPRTRTAPTGGFGIRAPETARGERERPPHEPGVGRARAPGRDHPLRLRRGGLATGRARLGAALGDQVLQLVHELVHVAEGSIDRREAHVGDRVERVQLAHDRLADHAAGDLALAALLHLALDAVGHRLDGVRRDRSLLARAQQAVHDLLPVERLAPPVLLDHQRQRVVDPLVGGEAPAAALAVPPAPDDVAFLPEPRVDDPAVRRPAERAPHRAPASQPTAARRWR